MAEQDERKTAIVTKDTPSYSDDPYYLWVTCPHCGEDNIFCQMDRSQENWGGWGKYRAKFCPDCGIALVWQEGE